MDNSKVPRFYGPPCTCSGLLTVYDETSQ